MRLPWWIPFGSVPEVSAVDLALSIERGVLLQIVDVRSPTEFGRGCLAGAVNVPVTSLGGRLPSLGLDRSRPVVAICLSAHRSPPAVRLLAGAGYDARQLAGGMLAWWAAGLPVIRP
jgi:rhodanese-related sulfurtransferase